VVLLVLAIVWGAVFVSWLRSRSGGGFSDSVGAFRRHLIVLERATPVTVLPANRMRSGPIAGRPIPAYRTAGTLQPGRRPALSAPSGNSAVRAPAGTGRASAAAVLRRRQVQQRRRNLFFALLAGMLGSLLLAILPSLRAMIYVQLLFDALFAAYVMALVRLRNLAAERELKLAVMPRSQPRRRPVYEVRGGYGDLALRRVAN